MANSAVRFADYNSFRQPPSSKLLGYSHSSATADWQNYFWCKAVDICYFSAPNDCKKLGHFQHQWLCISQLRTSRMKNNNSYTEAVEIYLESQIAVTGEKDVKCLSAFSKSAPFASPVQPILWTVVHW